MHRAGASSVREGERRLRTLAAMPRRRGRGGSPGGPQLPVTRSPWGAAAEGKRGAVDALPGSSNEKGPFRRGRRPFGTMVGAC